MAEAVRRGKHESKTDWEIDTGLPWPQQPLGTTFYAQHHYRDGFLIVPAFGPFRLRDHWARLFGYHCWECMRWRP